MVTPVQVRCRGSRLNELCVLVNFDWAELRNLLIHDSRNGSVHVVYSRITKVLFGVDVWEFKQPLRNRLVDEPIHHHLFDLGVLGCRGLRE